MKTTPMTEQQAKAVYAVLQETCGAGDDELSFVYEFTKELPTTEWRFGGSLGFGGKFRYPRMSVDCYPEDESAARLAMISAANAKLAVLKTEFERAE